MLCRDLQVAFIGTSLALSLPTQSRMLTLETAKKRKRNATKSARSVTDASKEVYGASTSRSNPARGGGPSPTQSTWACDRRRRRLASTWVSMTGYKPSVRTRARGLRFYPPRPHLHCRPLPRIGKSTVRIQSSVTPPQAVEAIPLPT